jgi:hypothetical protein
MKNSNRHVLLLMKLVLVLLQIITTTVNSLKLLTISTWNSSPTCSGAPLSYSPLLVIDGVCVHVLGTISWKVDCAKQQLSVFSDVDCTTQPISTESLNTCNVNNPTQGIYSINRCIDVPAIIKYDGYFEDKHNKCPEASSSTTSYDGLNICFYQNSSSNHKGSLSYMNVESNDGTSISQLTYGNTTNCTGTGVVSYESPLNVCHDYNSFVVQYVTIIRDEIVVDDPCKKKKDKKLCKKIHSCVWAHKKCVKK